jgi:hypothetical protein
VSIDLEEIKRVLWVHKSMCQSYADAPECWARLPLRVSIDDREALLAEVERLRAWADEHQGCNLYQMTDEQRRAAFDQLREAFCLLCGRKKPESGWCPCHKEARA